MTWEEFCQECDSIPVTLAGCRIWRRGLTNGYPMVWFNKRCDKGHRLALQRKLGRMISSGYFACHTCDNKDCVEMSHLYEATHRQNMTDGVSHSLFPRGLIHWSALKPEAIVREENHGMSKLTVADVKKIKQLFAEGTTVPQVARQYSLAKATIADIYYGRHWKNVKP